MLFTDMERERRWSAARSLMVELDLDAIVVRGTPAIDGHANFRWLSLYTPLTGDAAVVLSPDDASLILDDGAQAFFASHISWFGHPTICPAIIDALLGWLRGRGVKRLGLTEMQYVPHRWIKDIAAICPSVEFVDISTAMLDCRTVKSSEELVHIEESARLADEVWRHVPDIVKQGRTEFEILADCDSILRHYGCDMNFNVILPMRPGTPMDRQPSHRKIQQGDCLVLEITPRLHGYFTQLTGAISVGSPPPELSRAYKMGIESRRYAAQHIRENVDARDISAKLREFFEQTRELSVGPVYGHMMGLQADEPRIGAEPYKFKANSAFVFHPFVVTPGYNFVMRGDTFLVETEGARRLNKLTEEMIII